MSKNHVIIVAGGSGTRMCSELPKQFLLLLDKPIIIRSIEQFIAFDPKINIIVVLPEHHFETWHIIQKKYLERIHVTSVLGGKERTDSVKNGLLAISNSTKDDVVAVHDAVRPLVSVDAIKTSFDVARARGSAIVSIALKDSIREVSGEKSRTKERSNYCLVQTPQTFQFNLLSDAYQHLNDDNAYTDDASVYEANGGEVVLVNGDYSNLKITTPEDMIIAEALLNKKR